MPYYKGIIQTNLVDYITRLKYKGFQGRFLSESYLDAEMRESYYCLCTLVLVCFLLSDHLQPWFGMLHMILEFPGRVNLLWFSCVMLLFAHCVFVCVFVCPLYKDLSIK